MAYEDKMGGCASCVKYTLGVVNLLLFIGGATLMGIGIWSLVASDTFQDLLHFQMYRSASYIATAAGAFVALITFLGCCGAFKESKVLLYLFFCFVFVLFVLLLAAGILAYVYRNKLEDLVEDDLMKTLKKYDADQDVKRGWDATQKELKCCGVKGASDWTTDGGRSNIPSSCCKDGKDPCPVADAYSDGCIGKLVDKLKSHSHVVAGIAIAIAMILLLAMVMACVVIKAIQ